MIQNNVINNIDIDKLPEHVQDAMFMVFKELPVKNKLIVLSRLTHGNLFKSERNDIFKPNKTSVAKIFDLYLDSVKKLVRES